MAKKIKKVKTILNDQQIEVVNHTKGPCVVIAVAGAGKTTGVVHRIARLIKEEHIRHEHILAVTFTKKAAKEMNERIKKLYIDTDLMQVSTFHSVCYRILKEEIDNLPDLDSSGNKAQGLLNYVLGYQVMDWNMANLADVGSYISNCKNALIEPKDATGALNYPEAYRLFESHRKSKKFITFDDLIMEVYKLFMKKPNVLKKWQKRFKYVIVDEFQDTNTAQYEIMKLLAFPENNLMVVGDDDQSIYSWRGAVPDYMINFENEFGAKVIRMEKNYRCPTFIRKISNPLIEQNKNRLLKTLDTQKKDMGDLQVIDSFDFDEEAENVMEYIEGLPEFQQKNYNEIVILFRTNAQSRAIEDIFISNKIPYEMAGGASFYDRKEIKDILMYFYAAFDIDYRSDEGFDRVLNIPFRFLGRTFKEELSVYRKKMKYSFEEGLRDMPMTGRQQGQVDSLLNVIDGLRKRKNMNPSQLIPWLMKEINYESYIKRFEGEGDSESNRISNLVELARASTKFKTIHKYIQYIDKIKAQRQKKTPKNKIVLSSIHRSKGLEWNNVIILGCNELILPHSMNLDTDANLEEERRLAYVGITRTKKRLLLSKVQVASVSGGVRDLLPSRFLNEMQI